MLTQVLPTVGYNVDRAPIHDVGRLTAEAMKAEFESAAKEIEQLGTELLTVKARIDKEQDNIMAAIDQVHALAKAWRDEGARISSTVADCAQQTQRVRDICGQLTVGSIET
jgi:predicted  nucleic acid-binding Zn-ribbon protein